MKIVVLNGSPRGNGDTSKMVRAFVDTAEQEGENTVRVSMSAGCRLRAVWLVSTVTH